MYPHEPHEMTPITAGHCGIRRAVGRINELVLTEKKKQTNC